MAHISQGVRLISIGQTCAWRVSKINLRTLDADHAHHHCRASQAAPSPLSSIVRNAAPRPEYRPSRRVIVALTLAPGAAEGAMQRGSALPASLA